jgi:hypothetical protein
MTSHEQNTMPTDDSELRFRIIRKAFIVMCREREKYEDPDHRVWTFYRETIEAGRKLEKDVLWARDLFALLYTELFGAKGLYEHYCGKMFDPPMFLRDR